MASEGIGPAAIARAVGRSRMQIRQILHKNFV
jgi:hypothetical protein